MVNATKVNLAEWGRGSLFQFFIKTWLPFADKGGQRNERALTFQKSRSKRYAACSDVVGMEL